MCINTHRSTTTINPIDLHPRLRVLSVRPMMVVRSRGFRVAHIDLWVHCVRATHCPLVCVCCSPAHHSPIPDAHPSLGRAVWPAVLGP